MQYIITGNCRGQRITKAASSDFLAFTIIGQFSQDGVTDICMKEVKPEEAKVSVPMAKEETQGIRGPVRMRTISQVLDYLKKEDPETSISENYLRTLVKQNKIPYFKAGARYLINLDILINYLSKDVIEEDEIPFSYGTIRRVME